MVGEVPPVPVPVLKGSNELTPVPLDDRLVAPVEIGPTVPDETVEFGLKVDGPPEELGKAQE